jgi:rod shape-determining protein MreC
VELEFFTQTQDIEKGDLLISSGMGQVFPKNYPVADVTAIARDPGQDFATVRARLRVAVNSTRNVMLINPVAETVAQPAASDLEASVDTAANSQALAEQVQQ